MSDALNPFWDYYVAILVVVSILACGVLLWSQTKRRVPRAQVETTGHVWDGDLTELNNSLPRWWMWLFYITIAFGLLYLVLFPGTALWGGMLGWSSTGQFKAENARADQKYGPLYSRFAGEDLKLVAADARAHAIGERLFMNSCAQCHGSDARGSKGFPNLTDNDWLFGGAPETIQQTILEGRHGLMPPMAAALGSADDVRNVANYVVSLSGGGHDSLRAALGRSKFGVCAACHGADGKGNLALGAPNLTDKVWLFGGSVESIIETITKGRESVMPAQKDVLGPDKVHVLAAYVWSLSHAPGEVTPAGTPATAAAPPVKP